MNMDKIAVLEHLRPMTWAQWKKLGGCGLSGISEGMTAQKLGKLDTHTISEISDAWAPAGREIVSFYINHMQKVATNG